MKNKPTKLSRIKPTSLLSYLIAASISLTIGIILFKAREIAPFGEKSVLCMDLWGQYFPMYVNNINASSLSELLHSWNGALGYNNWAQSAYYCNSIFILLMKFVPAAKMVKALDLFCLAKCALSAMTCLGMLRYKTKSQSPALIGGAVCYSLCSYMMAFMSQFMWTDALIYTPLIVIGIEKLIHERKPLLYVIALAVTMICSFYIGFAVCIFSLLYFITKVPLCIRLTKDEDTGKHHIAGVRNFFPACLRFGVYSLIAGALAAFVVIPVYLGITNTLAVEAQPPTKLEWYGNFTQVLQYALPSQGFFQEYVGVNIYCGILVFLAVPLYFTNKMIRIPERIFSAFMLVFLVASMNCNILNYVWHGFHFPNQLPGRWVFLFSLYVILLSCQGLANYKGLTIIRTILGSGAGIALLRITIKGKGTTTPYNAIPKYAWPIVIASASLIVVGSIIAFIIRKKSDKAKNILWHICTAAVACMMVFDIGRNLITIADYEGNRGFQASDEVTYSEQLVRHIRNGKRINSSSTDFYRVEANGGFTFNPSMIDNCKGLGYYSSTMNGSVFSFLRYMGNRVYADKVSSVYNISSPVQNSIFGLKYIVDYQGDIIFRVPGTVMHEQAIETDPAIYENTTAFPIAFAVSDDILNYHIDDQGRGLENQNRFLTALCGQEARPYVKVEPDSVDPVTVRLDYSNDLNTQYYYLNDGETEPRILYEFTAPQTGLYFLNHNFRAGSIHVTAFNLDRTVDVGNGAFAYCGNVEAGGKIQVEFSAKDIVMGCHGLDLYYIDEQLWDKQSKQFKAGGIDVTEASGTKIKGTVELSQPSLMLMTTAQDGGWSVYCDGNKLETSKGADLFPCFNVPEGKHELVMKYRVPGLGIGLLITMAGLAFLLLSLFLTSKFRKKAEDRAEAEEKARAEAKAAREAEEKSEEVSEEETDKETEVNENEADEEKAKSEDDETEADKDEKKKKKEVPEKSEESSEKDKKKAETKKAPPKQSGNNQKKNQKKGSKKSKKSGK